MIKLMNVLVATDFSETSESALNYGRELARTFGARLHVLHVVENAFIWVGPDAVGIDFVQLQADLEVSAWNRLNRLVTTEDRDQLNAVTQPTVLVECTQSRFKPMDEYPALSVSPS